QLLLERALPPPQRLARHRARPELRYQLLVEDDATAVAGEAEPGARQLFEALAADPEDRVLRHAVFLGLARLLDQLGIAAEGLVLEPGLAQQLVVVHKGHNGGDVRQSR